MCVSCLGILCKQHQHSVEHRIQELIGPNANIHLTASLTLSNWIDYICFWRVAPNFQLVVNYGRGKVGGVEGRGKGIQAVRSFLFMKQSSSKLPVRNACSCWIPQLFAEHGCVHIVPLGAAYGGPGLQAIVKQHYPFTVSPTDSHQCRLTSTDNYFKKEWRNFFPCDDLVLNLPSVHMTMTSFLPVVTVLMDHTQSTRNSSRPVHSTE